VSVLGDVKAAFNINTAPPLPTVTTNMILQRGSLFLPLPRDVLHVGADDGVHGAERRGARV